MATSDTELVREVRALTGYSDGNIISDAELHELVNLTKEELRAEFDDPNFSFYQTGNTNTIQADRALFWFVCIASKIRTGELGGFDVDIADIRTDSPDDEEYKMWFQRFNSRLASAASKHASSGGGPSQVSPQRDGRSYGDSFDVNIRE